MIVDRYYYHSLSDEEKNVYKIVYAGVKAHQDLIPVPSNLPEEAYYRVFAAVTSDNPLLYYCNHSAISLAEDQYGNIAYCPQYYFKADQVEMHNKKIQNRANEIIAEINLTEGTDYEKVLKINDYFCKNIQYDDDGSDTTDMMRVIMAHNILGVFAKKRAQCEGIAKAVKVLLNAVDVKCIVAEGTAILSDGKQCLHAWNVVKLDGVPYHLDVTHNIGATMDGYVGYDWLNLSDKMIKGNHIPDQKLPPCPSDTLNYYTVNHAVFSVKKRALDYVKREIKSGKRVLYLRFTGMLKAANIYEELMQTAIDVLQKYAKEEEKLEVSGAVNPETNTLRVWIHK